MNFTIYDFKEWYKSLYSSQDSKYFILTATKLTLVPIISFGIVFYSLWTFMEMNFNFFVANGFASGDLFKEAFYDQIFGDISEYVPYLFSIVAVVFLTGLFVSWLVLRTFDRIEFFTIECFENAEQDFEVHGLNKNKLLNQVARIFFKYLQICKRENKRPKFKLPKKMENLSYPPFDKVFLLQYSLIVAALSLLTSLTLFSFTNEIYEQIINGGIEVLPSNKSISVFLGFQKEILFNIYFIAIVSNISMYILISKSIIKNVDGVSFGFARDMLRIISGEHHARLRPRFSDPGNGLANTINDYLDSIFEEQELAAEPFESVTQAMDDSYGYLIEQDINEEYEEQELKPLSKDSDEDMTQTNVLEMDKYPAVDTVANEIAEDLPPVFIQEKMVSGGEKIFSITTPDGLKVENVDAEMLLRIVAETKK